ncbi:polyadenylate-binding protein [Pseudozyma hubeiensis SY62]|uniref:Polyadenylate-binding protein n=1 Tax=Pseudozyma hubeiensis (strain SY62) TaxID=1305764 RepID=R9P8B5_PSEHS|nr:polyadenylate-binding protein [Pseudozyma hubeiensis SY62]GAC97584.1 polyadenylate-binding protein [Pseudozyma hubeiensis SY62]
MIPRSDRMLFRAEDIPTMSCKSPPLHSSKIKAFNRMPPPTTTATRCSNGKRVTAGKEPRKPRIDAPATPWRPRISRKTPSAALNEHDQPSPLDRKAAGSTLDFELGSKLAPATISPAPTSATLVTEADNGDQPRMAADAYRRDDQQPPTPRLEQGENWRTDRWRLLRPETSDYIGQHAFRPDTVRQQPPAFRHFPRASTHGVEGAAYQASARREMDMSDETNVYVNGLPTEMNDHMLYLLGSACGVVISHKSMIDRQTGMCKGFGFLMYASNEMARHAVEWLNSHGFIASFAKESFSARLRRMADTSSTNVYLSNLPLKFTVLQLEQLFAPYPIASLKILYDVHGENRGVGFVRLFDRATAKECIERLHGRMLPGTTLPLQVRFADSEAQKHLKHNVSQKQTLESLGLFPSQRNPHHPMMAADTRGPESFWQHGAAERIRSASELNVAVAHARLNSHSLHGPPLPMSNPPFADQSKMGRVGLGIHWPDSAAWPLTHSAPTLPSGMIPSETAARVMVSGAEGGTFERPYFMSPVAGREWIEDKPFGGHPAGYAAVPFIPPPGLTPAHRHAHYMEHRDATFKSGNEAPTPTLKPGYGGSRHMRNRNRDNARDLASKSDSTGVRAVSDPMAMLAAQTRIRAALGMPDRVRAAVSADNSIDEGPEAVADTSIVSTTSPSGSSDVSCDEDDSLSVEIQIRDLRLGH